MRESGQTHLDFSAACRGCLHRRALKPDLLRCSLWSQARAQDFGCVSPDEGTGLANDPEKQEVPDVPTREIPYFMLNAQHPLAEYTVNLWIFFRPWMREYANLTRERI